MTIFIGTCPNCEKWVFMKGETTCPVCGWPDEKNMDAYAKEQTDSSGTANKRQLVSLRLAK